ncbi:MAG: energy transducer TonB [Rhodanobacteraceae bacterium]
MKHLCALLVVLALPALAFARGVPVQESMVVTGTITVNPQGNVQDYTLYERKKLSPVVREIVQRVVPHFEFYPVMAAGKPVTARTGMSLRIVLDTTTDAQRGTVRVAGAEFGCAASRARKLLPNACPVGTAVSYQRRSPPTYPYAASQARVGGQVLLVLEVGRNGHVTQVAARQVNLFRLTDDAVYYRKLFADASVRAARNWTFQVPTAGPAAAKDHWIVQVPVNFTMWGSFEPRGSDYGRWLI